MPRFSERMGIRPVKTAIQVTSMDDDLRNSLWNVLTLHFWEDGHWDVDEEFGVDYWNTTPAWNMVTRSVIVSLWRNFFKWPIDLVPETWTEARDRVREWFFRVEWHEVYDLIDFVGNLDSEELPTAAFCQECNEILTREVSGYRFVGGLVTPLTSPQEIEAIEDALTVGESVPALKPVGDHMSQALALLADRQAPDYRNSMKESISAVEALCKLIAGDPKATLTAALSAIEAKTQVAVHPSLRESFVKLYGYTSDAGGIRHALKGAPNVDQEDAIYMLVTCSAFVNYLVVKVEKAGIAL